MTSVYSYNQQTRQMTRVNGGVTNIYSYSADGKLQSISIPGEGTVSYQYDVRGLNTEIILPGGIRRIQSYDGFGQLSAVQVKDSVGNNVLSQSYQRSLTGSLQSKTTGSGVWNYGYDLTDQLTNAVLTGSAVQDWAYAYDKMGNRLFSHENAQKEITYQPNNLNQYLSITTSVSSVTSVVNLLYDLNGNLTNDSVRAYSWDLRNQLVEVETLPNAQSLRTKVCFSYDYMGRRIRKDVYSYSAQSQWSKAQSLSFFYDGWNLVKEIAQSTNNVSTNLYVWGNDLSGSLQGAGGVGGLLCTISQPSAPGSTPQAYFPCYDHNGNVEKIIRGNGQVIAEYQYDAFGNTISESIAQGLRSQDFPIRFSTKYWDSETGLAYYGYRYYSPEKGRWLNRDPIKDLGWLAAYTSAERPLENAGDENLYAFVVNDPVDRIDILGLDSLSYKPPNSTEEAVANARGINPNVITVTGHSGGWYVDDQRSGKTIRISPQVVANHIRNLPDYSPTKLIHVYFCYGASVAKEISKFLPNPVKGATTEVVETWRTNPLTGEIYPSNIYPDKNGVWEIYLNGTLQNDPCPPTK